MIQIPEAKAQHEEARLLIRWAASDLTATERGALMVLMGFASHEQAGRSLGLGRAATFMAKFSAIQKMRSRLKALGIESTRDLLDLES